VTTALFSIYLIGSTAYGAINGGTEVPVHQEVPLDELDGLPTSSDSGPLTPPSADEVITPSVVPVTIRIRDANGHQLLLSTARDLILIAFTVTLVWLIRQLLLSVREGDPFTATNVRRLRIIGFLFAVGVPIGVLIIQALEDSLAASSEVGELGSSFSIGAAPLLVGLGVFILAEVFAHGVRMRDDLEGTV
jgi:hypothetical protein